MKMRQNRFNISTGVIEVNYPDKMTADDLQDFKDQMAITFRILERNIERLGADECDVTASHAN